MNNKERELRLAADWLAEAAVINAKLEAGEGGDPESDEYLFESTRAETLARCANQLQGIVSTQPSAATAGEGEIMKTNLSDEAKDLAAILAGASYRYKDGALTGIERHDNCLEIPTDARYEASDFLRFAAAALELAGEKVEWFDRSNRHSRTRYYRLADEEAVVVVEQVYQLKPTIQVYRSRDLAGQNVTGFAAILLHAAATAREWEGEKS
jgi:hypothetical protein